MNGCLIAPSLHSTFIILSYSYFLSLTLFYETVQTQALCTTETQIHFVFDS